MIGSIMGKDWPLVEGIDPSKIVVAVCLDRISRGGQPPNKFVTLLEPLYADPYEKEKGILQVQVQLRNKRDESVVKEMEFHRSFLTSDIREQWGSFSLQHLADPVYTVWKNAMNNNRRGLKVSEYADFLHQSLGNQVKVFTSVKDPEQQVSILLLRGKNTRNKTLPSVFPVIASRKQQVVYAMVAIKNKKKEKQKGKNFAISAVKLVISQVKEKSATGVQIQTVKEPNKLNLNLK